jgi:hypothetical protein
MRCIGRSLPALLFNATVLPLHLANEDSEAKYFRDGRVPGSGPMHEGGRLGVAATAASRGATSYGPESVCFKSQKDITHRARRPLTAAWRPNALSGQLCRHLAQRQAASS